MDKLRLKIPGEGYSVARPDNEVIGNKLDGGFSETSLGIEGGALIVALTWILDSGDWQYFESFFRNRIAYGVEPFLTDLMIDGGEVAEYTVKLDPSVNRQVTTNGPIRTVHAQLEVLPAPVDDDADSSIVDIYEASGGDMEGYINGFAKIVENWPAE